ncbi:hypothetical protein TNIN_199451 [Trichonephila inaurata madagascariensis]|uniref:Uncharacterized protein n=1 Tax=Trichonephila inaurata madagascariensis TaxID=2747483 RepID=A0A8X6X7F0_9ARAC|nr:hypothetical protein TNIN_199451 [Trichonephila inaurata madagascariensis]
MDTEPLDRMDTSSQDAMNETQSAIFKLFEENPAIGKRIALDDQSSLHETLMTIHNSARNSRNNDHTTKICRFVTFRFLD